MEQRLESLSVVFLGDDTTLNNAVAAKFAESVGYSFITTQSVVEKFNGLPFAEVESSEGRDVVAATEVAIVEELSTMVRCSIGTLGGGYGATARCGAVVVIKLNDRSGHPEK